MDRTMVSQVTVLPLIDYSISEYELKNQQVTGYLTGFVKCVQKSGAKNMTYAEKVIFD